MPRLHSRTANDNPETIKFPPIPEVVWQQHQESHSTNIHITLTNETHTNTQMLDSKQKNDVKSQTSLIKETPSQVSGSSTEPLSGNQTGDTPVHSLSDFKERQFEIQRHQFNTTANDNGDDNISPPKITNSQIEGQLLRDDITNELFMPLFFTIVCNPKKMPYVPLDFKNGVTIDALVDSGAYNSAIAQTELDRMKQQAPPTSSESTTLPIFKYKLQMAS